jgi:lipid-binding SYLF domain-containing protein
MKYSFLAFALVLPLAAQSDSNSDDKLIHQAATVLRESLNAGDQSIPTDIIRKAQCVGIVPGLKKAGFIVGGEYGKGVIVCRTDNGRNGGEWSAPAVVKIEGGSVGFQIGAGETDLIFVVMNRDGERKLMQDKFTFGADAGVMAGPVGRSAEAQTDAQMHAEILGYSRSRGVFAGVALNGATMSPQRSDDHALYGRDVTTSDILHGDVPQPGAASALYDVLNSVGRTPRSGE